MKKIQYAENIRTLKYIENYLNTYIHTHTPHLEM